MQGLSTTAALGCVLFVAARAAGWRWRALVVCVWVLVALLTATRVISDSILGEGVSLAVLYHAMHGIQGAGLDGFQWQLWGAAVGALVIAMVVGVGLLWRRGEPRGTVPIVLLACLLLPVAHPATADVGRLAWLMRGDDVEVFNEAYARATVIDRPTKNLVWFYLEGLERGFLDEARFPSLAPELTRLAARGRSFTDIRPHLGSGGTIAGIVATQCGIPLIPDGRDALSIGQRGAFLPRARCLGDVLADSGYRMTFVGGARLGFSGKGEFLAGHGYQRILGLEQLGPLLDDPAYLSSWGLHDDTLFDVVLDEWRRLHATPGPYGLVALTLATHDHRGILPVGCAHVRYGDGRNGILNAVRCTSALVGRVLDTAAREGLLRDTVLVLGSDHLMGKTQATHLLVPPRRNFLTIIDGAGVQESIDTPGLMLDVGATVLDLLTDGAHTAVGLGRSLRAPGGSLALRDGTGERYAVDRWLGERSAGVRRLWSLPDLRMGFRRTADGAAIEVGGQRIGLPVLSVIPAPERPALLLFEAADDNLNDLALDFAAMAPGTGYILIDRCRGGQDGGRGGMCLSHGFYGTREMHSRPFPPGASEPPGLPYGRAPHGRTELAAADDMLELMHPWLMEDVLANPGPEEMFEVAGVFTRPLLFGASPQYLPSFIFDSRRGLVEQAEGVTLFALSSAGRWRAAAYAPRCSRTIIDGERAQYWRDFEARVAEADEDHFVVLTGSGAETCGGRAPEPNWGTLPASDKMQVAWRYEYLNHAALFSRNALIAEVAHYGPPGVALVIGACGSSCAEGAYAMTAGGVIARVSSTEKEGGGGG